MIRPYPRMKNRADRETSSRGLAVKSPVLRFFLPLEDPKVQLLPASLVMSRGFRALLHQREEPGPFHT